LTARRRAGREKPAVVGCALGADGAGAMKSARLCDVKIYDFLLGAFWVAVTLFALLFWGTVAYVAWAFIAKAW
jgi:hypothetical protein